MGFVVAVTKLYLAELAGMGPGSERSPGLCPSPALSWPLKGIQYTLAEGMTHSSSAISGPVSLCFRLSHVLVTPRSKWIVCDWQNSSL